MVWENRPDNIIEIWGIKHWGPCPWVACRLVPYWSWFLQFLILTSSLFLAKGRHLTQGTEVRHHGSWSLLKLDMVDVRPQIDVFLKGKIAQYSLPHFDEAYKLRGETLWTLKYMLTILRDFQHCCGFRRAV